MPSRIVIALLVAASSAMSAQAQVWTFAVSGDSRNCGDFVMPAIAARVSAEHDAFYWHLGDFRWMSQPDEDLQSMQPSGQQLDKGTYQRIAWDDFLTHQMAAFGTLPVFLGRGNHENVTPMTRDGYTAKFSAYLNRPEIVAQRRADGPGAAPIGPWYHWTQNGVDFITLDNADREEFSDAQLRWLRGVLDRDLAPNSGIRSIVAGMHEALPHSTGAEHAMDDWPLGQRTGEQVYQWFQHAQAAGKHVYLLASHSHYYSPDIFHTSYWESHGGVVPGIIIGSAGARRYKLPATARSGAKTHIYGYLQGRVLADGSIDFQLRELSESELMRHRWPNAQTDAIHECYIHNADTLPVPRHFLFF
ncbi:MAG: hypothetical protein P4L40_21815 [Terracidiphilus sp.]|nr:hypothetical protein [Terracidiphilus sp.]